MDSSFGIIVVVVGGLLLLILGGTKISEFARRRAHKLRDARDAYTRALDQLAETPDSSERRVVALEAGRNLARIERQQAGSQGVAIFDEVALQNDLHARSGRAANPSARASMPVVVTSDSASDRIDQLTRLGALRDQGVLTAAEFESEKTKILGAP